MFTFILVALAAISLMIIVWRWMALQRRNRRDGESFAGRSTISELFSKDKRNKKKS